MANLSKDVLYRLDILVSYIEGVLSNLEDNKQSAVAVSNILEKFTEAVRQHEIYVYNFRKLMSGESDWIPPQYTECNFGKIYYGLDDKYILNTYGETAHRIFKRLGDIHKDFHQIAENCLHCKNDYELKLLITELASKSSMLVDTLTSLLSSIEQN
ncbi:CZB domain-containing protein [Hydrogenobaculum acidophilum]